MNYIILTRNLLHKEKM